MKTKENPLSRRNEIVVQTLDNEILIYDLKQSKAFCLNETSALIWQLCDGSRSVEEIRKSVNAKLKTFVPEDLVWLALTQLKEKDLLQNELQIKSAMIGISRRETIKKIGAASMIALPIITSLIAPKAANAQSGTVCNTTTACTCSNPNTLSGVAQLCRGTLGGTTAQCTNTATCDCFVSGGIGNTGGTCTGT